jgi:hypothetical protein
MTAMAADGLVPEIAPYDYWGSERLALSVPGLPVTVGQNSWEYRRGWAYYLASYTKMALALRTAERLVGSEAMARGLRSYVDRYRYRHPTGNDLVEVLNEATGWDLGPFFNQAVFDDSEADWAVQSVRHRRRPPAEGFVWDEDEWREVEAQQAADDDRWYVELELARRGEFVGPVDVELRWSDGTVERRSWDSETRWVRWHLESAARLEEVVIDPDVVWALETKRADNYWRDRPAKLDHPLWWVREAFKLGRHFFLRFS